MTAVGPLTRDTSARIRRVFSREGLFPGLRLVTLRAVELLLGRLNARLLGWPQGLVPWNSRIIGSRHIFVGSGAYILGPVWIEAVTSFAGQSYDPKITIGDRFSCSGELHVSAISDVTIGNACLFGRNVLITDHEHGSYRAGAGTDPAVPPSSRILVGTGPVRLGDHCWIGDGVVIRGGVTLGSGCIVGSNSVVSRDAPPGTILVGVPARPVRSYDPATHEWTRIPTETTAS